MKKLNLILKKMKQSKKQHKEQLASNVVPIVPKNGMDKLDNLCKMTDKVCLSELILLELAIEDFLKATPSNRFSFKNLEKVANGLAKLMWNENDSNRNAVRLKMICIKLGIDSRWFRSVIASSHNAYISYAEGNNKIRVLDV